MERPPRRVGTWWPGNETADKLKCWTCKYGKFLTILILVLCEDQRADSTFCRSVNTQRELEHDQREPQKQVRSQTAGTSQGSRLDCLEITLICDLAPPAGESFYLCHDISNVISCDGVWKAHLSLHTFSTFHMSFKATRIWFILAIQETTNGVCFRTDTPSLEVG